MVACFRIPGPDAASLDLTDSFHVDLRGVWPDRGSRYLHFHVKRLKHQRFFSVKNNAASPAGSAWIKSERFRLQGFSHSRDGARCFYLEFFPNGSTAPDSGNGSNKAEAGPPCPEAGPSHLRGTPASAPGAAEEGATLHPAPRTLIPEPCTLNPEPCTLNPESRQTWCGNPGMEGRLGVRCGPARAPPLGPYSSPMPRALRWS